MAKNYLPVWVASLGCPKNRVDTEKLLGSLGVEVKICKHIGKSKLVFINTCAFIEPATRESIREIINAIESLKKLKNKPLLVVAGCLPGRYNITELAKELPEVDLWLPPSEIASWPQMITKALHLNQFMPGRFITDTPYAWLKISDGCNHSCSFCTIPAIRGPLCSEPSDKVMAEANKLIAAGIKELVLVGQDVCSWGLDFKDNLANLLMKLAALPDLCWLRLLYLYPAAISDNLLQTMQQIGLPLLPYFDIPFQHSEQTILKSMGRPFSINPRNIIGKIRKYFPDAALRTTLITGYPGETDKDFQNLLNFVRESAFHNLGVFTFYAEEGAKAALLPNQVPEKIKEERKAEILKLQAEISRDILSKYVNQNLQIIVDRSAHEEWPGLHIGRVWFQAPEIDGITYISGPDVKPGAMIESCIEDSKVYDLVALQNI